MSFLVSLIPAALTLVGVVPLLGIILWWRERERRYVRESPLTRNLLRSPGYSLREKIAGLDEQLIDHLFGIISVPLLLFSVHVSQSYFANQPETLLRIVLTVCVGVVFTAVIGWRLLGILNEQKIALLGLEGELATGEELNQLMLDGCRVFHDIPFPYGNIDHVVVSQSGVYSVNSKLRGKPRFGEGNAEVTVDQQQGIIKFPDRECRIPIKQFEAEANWLSQQLTSSVGRSVQVEPILALLGWFVKERIGRGPVFVINPHKPKKFFVQNREILTPELVQQVAHQLEQLCRDVKPSFRKKQERWEDKN